ncbi:hypothetical protein GR212_15945 [Rhizobium lusitanum]|uniref:Uncharacterized protein n=1 Tax=Rhizobium lusitanum TaxID=293958 RepID=A0A6L9U9S1_9HYPH|nr:hypothetical protein [Rhizobium lusitanum]NEI71072.1 hypothetical protein [Rhizobium lusitanum]
MSETSSSEFNSLTKRCAEILGWHATGILTGDELRRSADFATYGDEALRQLEAKTAGEAMRFVIDHSSERQRHAEVMEEVRKVLGNIVTAVEREPVVSNLDYPHAHNDWRGWRKKIMRPAVDEARALLSRLGERCVDLAPISTQPTAVPEAK